MAGRQFNADGELIKGSMRNSHKRIPKVLDRSPPVDMTVNRESIFRKMLIEEPLRIEDPDLITAESLSQMLGPCMRCKNAIKDRDQGKRRDYYRCDASTCSIADNRIEIRDNIAKMEAYLDVQMKDYRLSEIHQFMKHEKVREAERQELEEINRQADDDFGVF